MDNVLHGSGCLVDKRCGRGCPIGQRSEREQSVGSGERTFSR